jgi:hypothetical protein
MEGEQGLYRTLGRSRDFSRVCGEPFNPFLHPTLKHLFYTWRVYWDPVYIDLIIPKVCVDPVFKDIFTPKVSCDPVGRMQRFNYT